MADAADLAAYIATRRTAERERVRARIFHHQLWVDATDPPGLTKQAFMRAYCGHFGGYFGGQYAGVPVPIITPIELGERILAADLLTPALGDQLSCWFILNNHYPVKPPRFYDVLWPRVQAYGVALFLEEQQDEWELVVIQTPSGPMTVILPKTQGKRHSLPTNMLARAA